MIRRTRFNKRVAVLLSALMVSLSFFSINLAALNAQSAKATLLVSPSKGSYSVGDKFNVSVYVNSGGGSGINAAESSITFSDNISVTNINQGGSIFELWTTKPTFSNKNGTISFGGGMTSGYTGSAGKIFTISFTAMKPGSAKVAFGGTVVTAADGMGTNVYGSSNFGTFTITDKAPEKPKVIDPIVKPTTEVPKVEVPLPAETPKVTNAMLPPAPEVTSPTHGTADQWYAMNDARFEWKNLSSVTGASSALNKKSSSTPATVTEGVIQNKEYKKLADGEYYFHVRLQNKDGWGPVTHRQLRIDTEAPSKPQLTIEDNGDTSNPAPLLKIYSLDKTSGMEKFKLIMGAVSKELPNRDYTLEPYRLDKLLPGAYSVMINAYDKAGNMSTSSIEFVVDALRAPTITDLPKEMRVGDDLTIRGASFYPKSTITIYIALGNGDAQSYEVKTDENGDWNYFHGGKLAKGSYTIWSKVTDDRGAESLSSSKRYMEIIAPGIIMSFGSYIIVSLVFMMILELLFIIYQQRKFAVSMVRVQDEATGAQRRVGDIFLALNEEVDELIELADKRAGLSESERRVKEKLKEALNISEEFLAKEIEDIEKEVVVEKKKKKK